MLTYGMNAIEKHDGFAVDSVWFYLAEYVSFQLKCMVGIQFYSLGICAWHVSQCISLTITLQLIKSFRHKVLLFLLINLVA